MKLQKIFCSFGIISVIAFALQEIFGIVLYRGYNAIAYYESVLIAGDAPYYNILEPFIYAYRGCFLIFILTMCVISFRQCHLCVRIGYLLLLIMAVLSAAGLSAFPLTIENFWSTQNLIHVLITVAIFSDPIVAIFLLAIGYGKQGSQRWLGRFCFGFGILFVALNILHLVGILYAMSVLGLLQRLIIYSFQLFTFLLSWKYLFYKKRNRINYYRKPARSY
ncbi:MAG: DUF998 domain-containing protein [Bacillota bacterium]|nr:DUF998 domain-containing protein [Bacillota bacterium]